MEQGNGFQNGVDYSLLLDKIKITKNNNYDCRILMFFAGEVIMNEEEVNLGNEFFPLLLYFDTFACENKIKFKEVVDYLLDICRERKLDSFDINYILNKDEVNKLIEKHKQGFVSNEILIDKLKKYFFTVDFEFLLELFEKRINVKIIL